MCNYISWTQNPQYQGYKYCPNFSHSELWRHEQWELYVFRVYWERGGGAVQGAHMPMQSRYMPGIRDILRLETALDSSYIHIIYHHVLLVNFC